MLIQFKTKHSVNVSLVADLWWYVLKDLEEEKDHDGNSADEKAGYHATYHLGGVEPPGLRQFSPLLVLGATGFCLVVDNS